MSTLRHDLWFFRKLMATREIAGITLFSAFMIFVLVKAEIEEVYPLIVLYLGFYSGLLCQRFKEQQQLILLPGFIKALTIIISATFLILAILIYTPLVMKSATQEIVKLAVFFYSLGLFFGFYIYITAWLFVLFPATLFISAFGYDQPANCLIIKPVELIYNNPIAYVLAISFALSCWAYGAFVRQSYIGQRRKQFWPTINSEYRSWSANSNSNKSLPHVDTVKTAFIALIGFIILEEIAILGNRGATETFDGGWALAGLVVFFAVRISINNSNLDRLWLSSESKNKTAFLLQRSLKQLAINLAALTIVYLYTTFRSPDISVTIPWFIVFYLLFSALCFVALRKRFIIPLCTLLSISLFYLFVKTPVWAVIIAGALYTIGLYYYTKGYGFNNGRLSAPSFGVAKV